MVYCSSYGWHIEVVGRRNSVDCAYLMLLAPDTIGDEVISKT
jgi:hypothetical protein